MSLRKACAAASSLRFSCLAFSSLLRGLAAALPGALHSQGFGCRNCATSKIDARQAAMAVSPPWLGCFLFRLLALFHPFRILFLDLGFLF